MKHIFFSLFICIHAVSYSQSYCTMASCGNDTLRYIEKNYQDNADSYIGKTIGNWADESELILNRYQYMPNIYSPWVDYQALNGKIEDIMFEITYKDSINY